MNGNLSTIRQEGMKALSRELGIAGTVVFLRQFESGNGDYTKEREETLKDTTIDDMVHRIKNKKQHSN